MRVPGFLARDAAFGRLARRAKSVLMLTDPLPKQLASRVIDRLQPGMGIARVDHVVVAPPGGGNLGDTAMVRAAVQGLDGSVAIVGGGGGAWQSEALLCDDVSAVDTPGLVYGGLREFVRDYKTYLRLVGAGTHVWVIGADIMDGAYNYRASSMRWVLAERAVERGAHASILGCSWNGAPDAVAKRYARLATKAGVRAQFRDPASLRRAVSDGLSHTHGVSDVVFDLVSRAGEPGSVRHESRARPYVIVNASGLIESRRPHLEGLAAACSDVLGAGLDIKILPHVSRPHDDDVAACRTLAARIVGPSGDARVELIEQVPDIDRVTSLARDASFVITGRMHLSIFAMGQGTPAVVLSTQGKVKGLLAMFGVEWLCIDTGESLEPDLRSAVGRLISEVDTVRDGVRERLPEVRFMSRENFNCAVCGAE